MPPKGPPPEPAEPTILITIVPGEFGPRVRTRFSGVPCREMANMMLATATQDIVTAFQRAEAAAKTEGPKPIIAPPGMEVARNPHA